MQAKGVPLQVRERERERHDLFVTLITTIIITVFLITRLCHEEKPDGIEKKINNSE